MIILYVILSLYFLLLIIFIYGWNKKEGQHFLLSALDRPTPPPPSVSDNASIRAAKAKNSQSLCATVVVPVRNEEKTIKNLLLSLNRQTHPSTQYEVIIVDDFSTDLTKKIIQDNTQQLSYSLTIINNVVSESPKKTAIELAVKKAKGEVILVTDGDCQVPQDWISSHLSQITKKDSYFITGPVILKGNSFFEKLQSMEFLTLIGSAAASLKLGYPTMANAANMSFSKKIFLEIKGYQNTGQTPSGDDELLMHKIEKTHKGKASFLKSEKATVTTLAQPNFKSFINQRKRWGSKWKFYQLPHIKALAIFIFSVQLSLLCLSLSYSLGKVSLITLGLLLGVRLLLEFIFLKSITQFLKTPFLWKPFLFLQLAYPFYVVVVGVLSNVGQFSWKGRTY